MKSAAEFLKVEALNPLLHEDAARRQRWQYLTEGLQRGANDKRGELRRHVMESMLDNVKGWAHSLAGYKTITGAFGIPMVTEETLVANIGTFTTFAYPLVRRVYSRLIATEIFSVQPMSQPTGKIFFLDFKYGTAPDAGNRIDVKANFNKNYADSSEGSTVKELNLDISSTDVSAQEKKLKAIWSIESQQDLLNYHGLSAEDELMGALADELVREVDQILLDDCLTNVGSGTFSWPANPGGSFDPADYVNVRAYNETLYDKITDANNAIYKARYRNASWIVADVDTCGRLEKLNGFTLDPLAGSDSQSNIQSGGRQFFGTLRNRWLIYKDPWATANTMLVGYKGNSFLDAGYVYSPYIPFYVTPAIVDPNDFKPRRGMMSRFAKKMVIPEMFAKVVVTAS